MNDTESSFRKPSKVWGTCAPQQIRLQEMSVLPDSHHSSFRMSAAHPSKHPSSTDSVPSSDRLEDFESQSVVLAEQIEPDFSKVLAESDVHPLSVLSSGSSEQECLALLEEKKEKYYMAWMDLMAILYSGAYAFDLYFLNELTCAGQAIILGLLSLHVGYVVVVGLCHFKKFEIQLWIPLSLLEVTFAGFFLFNHLPEDFIIKMGTVEGPRIMVQAWKEIDLAYAIAFFQSSFILVFSVDSRQGRTHVLIFLMVISAFFQVTNLQEVYQKGFRQLIKTILVVFIFGGSFSMDAIFTTSMYYIRSIQHTMLKLELEENRKFKYMFNSIQDAVILLEGQSPKFVNSFALKLLEDPENKSSSESLLDKPMFYAFQSQDGLRGSGIENGVQSLASLLEKDPKHVLGTIFTTSQEIAQCTRMDQVQRIVEERRDQEGTKFYSIRLIKVSKASAGECRGEEVMIQISDISLRVQGQYLKVERQYLALMNSTISHEMRNPLNALASQISQQKTFMEQLKSLANSLPPGTNHRKTIVDMIGKSEQSLHIAQSSTKLIKFNVEDILALPQLKQGKFTKMSKPILLEKSIDEIIRMMAFQAKEKHISIQVTFQGFSEPKKSHSIMLDEQRFQQVLLNYLSNALKFTEAYGSVRVILTYVGPDSDSGDLEYEWKREVEDVWLSKTDRSISVLSESFSGKSSEEDEPQPSSRKLADFQEQQDQLLKAMFVPSKAPRLVMTVVDTGVGITLEEQLRLFKLFGTIKRTKTVNTRGVGLGLSISKMICEEFGGRVAIQSRQGIGSAFLGSFNLLPGQEDTVKRSDQERELAQSLVLAEKKQKRAVETTLFRIIESGIDPKSMSRILVVDDEAYNCEVLKTMILSFKIPNIERRLSICLSGKEAFREIQSQIEGPPISVIFTDLSMPLMDGYSLVSRVRRQLRLRSSPQPVIAAITGHTEAEFICKAFKKGVDLVYSKPISVEQVRQVLLQGGIEF